MQLVTDNQRWRLDALGVNAKTIPLEEVRWDGTDWIFMLAGLGRPQPLNRSRVSHVGAELALHRAVLEQIARSGSTAAVAMASSRTVYGRPDHLPVSESAALRPATAYAAEKVFIEELYTLAARDMDIRSVRLRITNPFGPLEWFPGRGHGLLSQFARQAVDSGKVSVFGDGLQLRDYVHVSDVSALLQQIASGPAITGSMAVNVGSGEGTSIAHLARIVAEQANAEVHHVTPPVGAAEIDSGDFVADIERARAQGWSPSVSTPSEMAQVAACELRRLEGRETE